MINHINLALAVTEVCSYKSNTRPRTTVGHSANPLHFYHSCI